MILFAVYDDTVPTGRTFYRRRADALAAAHVRDAAGQLATVRRLTVAAPFTIDLALRLLNQWQFADTSDVIWTNEPAWLAARAAARAAAGE